MHTESYCQLKWNLESKEGLNKGFTMLNTVKENLD